MNAPAAACIYLYIYDIYTKRMRANITSPLHISNLISHMHNRKFPVARTRAHRQSSSLRGGISFQFLSHRTTVELFLTPLPPPLELLLSTAVARRQFTVHPLLHYTQVVYTYTYIHAHTQEHAQNTLESILDKWAAAFCERYICICVYIFISSYTYTTQGIHNKRQALR